MIKIMIVDDHEVVRLGLKNLLENQPNMKIIGEADTVKSAINKASALKPDVILLDVRLPDGSGIEACKEIHTLLPKTKIIILTSFPDDDIVIDAILSGATGFVLKEIKGNSLVDSIEKVSRGESLLDPRITSKVMNYMKTMNQPLDDEHADKLTKQEIKVLALVAEGKTNKEIGDELFLSERTVRNYLSRVLKKLDLSNRTQAAAYYVENYSQK